MSIKFNENQLKVINDNSHETIVSAGAGSGKTGTLVGKTTNLLKKGINLDQFLVLTFTNKAAFDMKEKIRESLLKDESLKEYALSIDSAHIETFDAFALNFVKQHASYLNKESNLEILDSNVSKFIKSEILERIIANLILKNDKDYNLYLKTFSKKFDFNSFIDSFISYHISVSKEYDINNLTLEDIYFDFNEINFKKFVDSLSEEFIEKNEEYLNTLNDFFLNFAKGIDSPIINLKIKEVKLLSKEQDKLRKIFYNIYKNNNSKDIKKFNSHLKTSTEITIQILKEFDKEYNDFKLKTNKYEFDDIANFVVEILKENNNILERLRNQFEYIFIDEYQDTSKIQSEFLNLLIKDNKKVKALYVGDLKQSIYKFRDAKPEYFINKKKEANLINLSINYRSSSKILTFVNKIFTNIFTNEEKHDLIYKGEHEMGIGNTKYDDDSHSNVYIMEVYSNEDYKASDFLREEIFSIGNEIKKLKDEGVIKEYNEVTILTRGSSNYPVFKDIFDFLNIPLQIQRERFINQNYFLKLISSILMLSKLTIEDINVNQKEFDFHYMAVGRSELFNLSDYDLFKTITNKDKKIYSDTIINKAKELSIYLKDYPNDVIIDKTIELFDVYNKINKTPNYDLKVIEIDYLYNISKSLNDLDINNLEFVNYIYNLTYSDGNKTSVNVLHDKEEKSVRLTNFHQSKGLEYDVLFVTGLTKKYFRPIDPRIEYDPILKTIYFEKLFEEGDSLNNFFDYYNHLNKESINNETYKEELRLLYVAFTRAKRMLFITIFNKEFEKPSDTFEYLLINSKVYDYVNNIKSYKSSLIKDYSNIKHQTLKYPSSLDNIPKINFIPNYEFKETKKASGEIREILNDHIKDLLHKGTMAHEKFEYADFNNIKNSKDQDLINFYNTKFGNKYLKEASNFVKEYEFLDEESGINGFIDLLVFYHDEIHIIDYKQSNIKNPNYEEQLKTYLKYLKKVYNGFVVKAYLYSINKVLVKEIVNS